MNFLHWVWIQTDNSETSLYLLTINFIFFLLFILFFLFSLLFFFSLFAKKKKSNTQVLSAYSSTCTQHSFVTNTRHILEGLTYFISYAADLPSTNICAPYAADLPHLFILCCWSIHTCLSYAADLPKHKHLMLLIYSHLFILCCWSTPTCLSYAANLPRLVYFMLLIYPYLFILRCLSTNTCIFQAADPNLFILCC